MWIRKTKAGNWEVFYRVEGRQCQKTFKKHLDAIAFNDKVKTQLREGSYVPPSGLTVKEIVEKWLEARKPRWKIQTYNGHKGHLDNYIGPQLGHFKATSLKAVDVETAGAEWKLAPQTVNKVFATLNTAYEFATKKLDIRNNPMTNVERLVRTATPEDLEAQALGAIPDHGQDAPEEKQNTLRAIGADEVYSSQELRKLIEASSPGLERALLMTAILTGLRHGELNALRWSTVDLKKGTIFVNRSLTQLKGGAFLEKPKTKNAYRRLRMEPELLSELRRWKLQCPPSPNGFVFADGFGRPMTRKQNNRRLKACCERAGVRVLAVNNLRHTFASLHLIKGTTPLKVSHMMGHYDPSVTLKVYSHWAEGEDLGQEIGLAGTIFEAEEGEIEREGVEGK